MFYNEGNATVCSICGESNYYDNLRCQNCRSRLTNRRNNRNRFLSYINNSNNELEIDSNNLFPRTNSIYKYNKPKREKLIIKIMTYDLYNKDKNGLIEPKICCICQENIELIQEIYLLSCSHCFHQKCDSKWFAQKSECPYCRKKYIFDYK